ncbi:uncharacterized protein LOC116207629 isoform X2 [Punica granatum]|uniref:Uncharacterized protein LOC116207629 isoform X2 n=1 Tax=Punica granatum TaxID=22663 RepID=A0A6P8DJY0_PUNGR|nr:uncharacterized protein LOC116207629 isoform X2 [Punica granatum]
MCQSVGASHASMVDTWQNLQILNSECVWAHGKEGRKEGRPSFSARARAATVVPLIFRPFTSVSSYCRAPSSTAGMVSASSPSSFEPSPGSASSSFDKLSCKIARPKRRSSAGSVQPQAMLQLLEDRYQSVDRVSQYQQARTRRKQILSPWRSAPFTRRRRIVGSRSSFPIYLYFSCFCGS